VKQSRTRSYQPQSYRALADLNRAFAELRQREKQRSNSDRADENAAAASTATDDPGPEAA
jgi:hypothetical protein